MDSKCTTSELLCFVECASVHLQSRLWSFPPGASSSTICVPCSAGTYYDSVGRCSQSCEAKWMWMRHIRWRAQTDMLACTDRPHYFLLSHSTKGGGVSPVLLQEYVFCSLVFRFSCRNGSSGASACTPCPSGSFCNSTGNDFLGTVIMHANVHEHVFAHVLQ